MRATVTYVTDWTKKILFFFTAQLFGDQMQQRTIKKQRFTSAAGGIKGLKKGLLLLCCMVAVSAYGQIEHARPAWGISVGVGLPAAYFFVDRYLSQDLSDFDHYTYRPGVTAGCYYKPGAYRWHGALLWSWGSSRAYTAGIGRTSNERIIRLQHYAALAYRHFHIRPKQYLYAGIGAGLKVYHYSSTQPSQPSRPSMSYGRAIHLVPLGGCVETGRVSMFFETALGGLPLICAGAKINFAKVL